MSRSAGWVGPKAALLGAMMTAVIALPGQAQSQSDQPGELPGRGDQPGQAQSPGDQDEGASRGVRIIDAPTLSPGPANAAPILKSPGSETLTPAMLTPAAPSSAPILAPPAAQPVPALTPPIIGSVPPAPAISSPAPELRPIPPVPTLVPAPAVRPDSTANVGSVPAAPTLAPPSVPYVAPPVPAPALNNFADLPKQPDAGVPSQSQIEALSAGLKIQNPAGLAMQIVPGGTIAVGSQVTFQVTSKKPGYLILVDVEATGKLVQIYPNPMSLMVPGGVRENANYLRPGKPLRIPDAGNVYAGFDFVASPPAGTAMVVAILGDRPVQLVDLPDVPVSLAGSASAVEYLTKLANGLRIPGANGNGRLEEAHWSFDAKFYAIR